MPDHTHGQFPSLDGDSDAEVAQRTEADTDGDWFRKVFTVHDRAWTRELAADHWAHEPNLGATLQAAIQQGLHPKGVPELASETSHSYDPHTVELTYRVKVVPAVSDDDPESTVTPTVLQSWLAGGGGAPSEGDAVPPKGAKE